MNRKMYVYNVTPINTDVTNLNEFEEKVKKVASLGATHVVVTEVPKNRWVWEEDLSDPYPNWGMLNSSLFKIILPSELKEWMPEQYANDNLKLVVERTKILRKYGLKAAAYFCEPFYMPEGVFRKHPSWRGPRCDHPRRSRRPYYSPCMDKSEVLNMYRESMKKLCELADIEYVYLHTNDSGSGICWSTGLYAGANGPESCKNISLSDRIINYFKVFQNGAKDAGKELKIETNSNIGYKASEEIMNSIWPLLDDGMAVNFKNNKGKRLSYNVDVNFEFTLAPVRNVPLFEKFLELLEEAYYDEAQIIKITYLDSDFDEYYKIIDRFLKKPSRGITSRMSLLNDIAKEIVPQKESYKLVEAWHNFNLGMYNFLDTCIEGFTWTSVNQRLLNRPFVLFPDELKDFEKDYYRKFQFQAQDDKSANDLLDNQGSSFVKGTKAVFLASKCLERTIELWNKVKEQYYDLSTLQNIDMNHKLLLGSQRIELLICFVNNYVNAMKFQDIIDRTNYDEIPEITSDWPVVADSRLTEYEFLTRKEIDNTARIIELIKNREHTMLVLASKPELEDVFWLSIKITEQLQKKIETMLNHSNEGKRLFVTNNL